MEYLKEVSFALSLLSTVVAVLYFARPEPVIEIKRREEPSLGDYKSITARD